MSQRFEQTSSVSQNSFLISALITVRVSAKSVNTSQLVPHPAVRRPSPPSIPHVSNILRGTGRHVSLFLCSLSLPLLLLFLIISKTNMCERGGRRRVETQDHAVSGLLISIMWEKLQTGRFTCPKHRRWPRFPSILPSLLMNESHMKGPILIWRNTPSFFIQSLNLLHSGPERVQ